MRKLLFLLLLIPAIGFAQGTTTQIRHGASLPVSCSPTNGDVFFKTGSNPGLYDCPTTNTWRLMAAASSGSPGGASTDVQINDSGSFYGDSQFTYNKSTHVVSIGNGSTRGTVSLLGASGAAGAPSASNTATIYHNLTTGKLGCIDNASADCWPAGGTASPLSTKGDVYVYGSANARLPVGTNGDVITADSTQALGVKWATPSAGSSGALILLEQHTASSSATLDFTTAITSTYDDYVIRFVNIVPATDGAFLQMRMSTNGGSSYDSGTNYRSWESRNAVGGGTASNGGGSSLTQANVASGTDGPSSTASNGGLNGHLDLFNPLSSTAMKQFLGDFVVTTNGVNWETQRSSSDYTPTTAVNAIRFFFSSGNIASGTIRIYGVAK